MKISPGLLLSLFLAPLLPGTIAAAEPSTFEGAFYRGSGEVEHLRLLDTARRMLAPDPELQNLPMLYMSAWNGLVEGPTWDAWWIQNSYGPSYCLVPFLQEPFLTFLQNSQDLWFDQMGDGKRVGATAPFNWVAPDGCLCDAARPGWIVYRQGDGRVAIHDWGMEFTAAGLLLQSELLLSTRDAQAIDHYLPKLERCARFIDSRRDPTNNLFLAGPAGNLLAPSFAGWKKPDGTYGKAYLAGLSITFIAALDRLIEVEKLAGRAGEVQRFSEWRAAARLGLAQLTTDEGYFLNSIDPDGTRHGVFGAARHGYFEASPNHDAVAFRVVDDPQARRIFDKIASIPGLRPHDFILPNYPSYDDMYEKPEGLWAFGTWVNGGHWSTCEARVMLGYYRLGLFEDARRSMRQLLGFAERFRMDNPLVGFGSAVYQPGQPINLTYDAFGPPAGFLRGLFEYLYRADGLTLMPHIPRGITRLEQRFPVRFGSKQLYLATTGSGPITAVTLNGQPWASFRPDSILLPYEKLPARAAIEIVLGDSRPLGFQTPGEDSTPAPVPPDDGAWLRLKRCNLAVNQLPLRIGADSNGDHRFRGDLASARVFSRALSSNEIAALARREIGALSEDAALVGDWAFDQTGGGAFASRAGFRLPARIVGKAEVVTAPSGKALRLDGSGYLEITPHPSLDLTNACTLEAWICPAALPDAGSRLIDKSEVGTSNGYLLDTFPAKSLRLISQAGTLDFEARLAVGQWAHVAATVGPDGQLSLYLQGKLVAQRSGSALPDVKPLLASGQRLHRFCRLLAGQNLSHTLVAAHARLALQCLATAHSRLSLLDQGTLKPLANPVSQSAADQSYLDTVRKLVDGLDRLLSSYDQSQDAARRQLAKLWKQAATDSN
jgi:hypothetical protein